MSDCVVAGWGTGAWGTTPWGGQPSSFGGPLPVTDLFGIYCFGPCGPMAGILTHVEVAVVETGPQVTIDGTSLDLSIESGGFASTDAAQLSISVPVPQKFTLELTAFFHALPVNFTTLGASHVYVGTFDAQGTAVGLFFSRAGLAYSGSVHFDAGELVLDGPLQPLPGSEGLVTEGAYFTIRLACDGVANVVYIYVTRTSDLHAIGHQLRFILPGLASSAMAVVPPDETLISVRGTSVQPSTVFIDTICLGQGLIIPNIIPFADAGVDQAIQRCTVALLDGTRSFDPEGAPLAYRWRLIDVPLQSQFGFQGLDGGTVPQALPSGFTDRLYSPALGAVHALDPLTPEDVLVIGGRVYVLDSVGVDGVGVYARIHGYVLPDNLVGVAFKYIRQRGVSGVTRVKPTFYPDVAGLYRFDLVVFDGNLFSEPSVTVLNVTESPVARGVTPDLRFLWDYLSDFWRLVEDRERLEVFWAGLAQVAAAELLSLWQIDYSKSLRDVQRTVQRRWLHYDFLMQERLPELSTIRAIYSGLDSVDIPTGGLSGVAGMHLDLLIDPLPGPVVVSFSGAGSLSATALQNALQGALFQLDVRFKVLLVEHRTVPGVYQLRITAPVAITVVSTSTAPLFVPGAANGLLHGAGSAIGPLAYKLDRGLKHLDVAEGDLLVLDGVGYRIARVIDDALDPWPFQRVILRDEIPIPAATSWTIPGSISSRTLDFDASLVSSGDRVTLEVLTPSGDAIELRVSACATCMAVPTTLAVDTAVLGPYLATSGYSVFLKSVLRRTFLPLDPLIVDIPYLQEKIRSTDDAEVLRRNVDYFLEERSGAPCLHFVTGEDPEPDVWQYGDPPVRMWAEVTYLDNRATIEGNFGIPADFTLDDLSALPGNIDYLSSVRGLWYAYFNGPTIFNLKAGTQILLGLPFAEEAGIIEEIRTDFSSTQGRLLIRDRASTAVVRSYTYPARLLMEMNPTTGEPYQVGDRVAQFAPLVTGVEVADWVKTPRWFEGYLQQGVFYEVEKFFKFLVRVDSEAFNLAALLFVQSFVRRIKPTSTFPLFVVLARISDTEISTTDAVRRTGTLYLNDLGVTNGALGMSTMTDEPRAAGGGWRSQLDADPSGTPPSYPESQLVMWGSDKNFLSPEDAVLATCRMPMPHFAPPDFSGGAPSDFPFLDGLFRSDLPLYDTADPLGIVVFHANHVWAVPAGPIGHEVELTPQVLGAVGTFDFCQLDITGDLGDSLPEYTLVVLLNGVEHTTIDFTVPFNGFVLAQDVSIAVGVGDELRVRIRPQALGVRRPYWHQVTVQLYKKVLWALDTPMPAGMYGSLRAL